eukprot:m.185126 g.185126  ORF g.185126 m.185126 type:complete len:164 (-) comp16911_c0_seq35:2788-3279(-)
MHRTYTATFMASLQTHRTRQVLVKQLQKHPDKVFLHVSDAWHKNLSSKAYVHPAEYATVLQDTVFAPCPWGHSADTFRFYEAIEAGAIPVLALDHGTRDYLPSTYLDGPVIVVPSWKQLWQVLMPLLEDKAKLDALQQAVMAWYKVFMTSKVQQLEGVLRLHS